MRQQRTPVARYIHVIAILIATVAGILLGSYISAELAYVWFPDQVRSREALTENTIAAFVARPLSMTFGLLPSLGYFGPSHGIVMILGMIIVATGFYCYSRKRNLWFAVMIFIGFVLWAHNNHLSLSMMMSV